MRFRHLDSNGGIHRPPRLGGFGSECVGYEKLVEAARVPVENISLTAPWCSHPKEGWLELRESGGGLYGARDNRITPSPWRIEGIRVHGRCIRGLVCRKGES